MRANGSYIAGVSISFGGTTALLSSVHVGPPNYRKHLTALTESLQAHVSTGSFVIGGDLNAARHLDHVYGGKWFTRYFEGLSELQMFDCHWARHQKEVQTFWGHQAREKYQCDHIFCDHSTALKMTECQVIDNSHVRVLSEHGPLKLELAIDPA